MSKPALFILNILILFAVITEAQNRNPYNPYPRQNGHLEDFPIAIKPACNHPIDKNHVLAAAYVASQEYGWNIVFAQNDYFRINYCRGGVRGFCVELDIFYVNGFIEIWLRPKKVKDKIRRTAVDWATNIIHSYHGHLCGNAEELAKAKHTLDTVPRPTWRHDSEILPRFKRRNQFNRWFQFSEKYRAQ
ncbi:hypothetical protein N9X87_00405 [bacterium]|nr:hypothetical protein [bacterium]